MILFWREIFGYRVVPPPYSVRNFVDRVRTSKTFLARGLMAFLFFFLGSHGNDALSVKRWKCTGSECLGVIHRLNCLVQGRKLEKTLPAFGTVWQVNFSSDDGFAKEYMYPDFGITRLQTLENGMIRFRPKLLVPDVGDYLGLN